MKRKEFEDAVDDFSCFSLAATARKSRRLDSDLPPIIEEEPDVPVPPVVPEQSFFPEIDLSGTNLVVPTEASPVAPSNPSDELAIVLYNPANAANQGMVKSPSSSRLSLVMNPELLSGFRSQMLHNGSQSRVTITEVDDDEESNDDNGGSNDSMAVVPWIASHYPQPVYPQQRPIVISEEESMEADGGDCEMMETEDVIPNPNQSNWNPGYASNSGMMMGGVAHAFPQPQQHQHQHQHPTQQQPHCLSPQYPPNPYTPIPW